MGGYEKDNTMSTVNPELIQRAIDNLDRHRLVKLVMDLVDIPSPTGYEGDVAKALNDVLNTSGIHSVLLPIGDDRSNALGRLLGLGGGK